jgi:hypothetical protein
MVLQSHGDYIRTETLARALHQGEQGQDGGHCLEGTIDALPLRVCVERVTSA